MKTILIVDDEVGLIESLAALLDDEGYAVVSAFNGRVGLERVAQTTVDAALVDIMMPLMGGVEFNERLKANPETKGIPVVAMTAIKLPREQVAAFDGFLQKPFNVDAVVEMLRPLVSRKPKRAAKERAAG